MSYTDELSLPLVTDEMLREALPTMRPYTLVILKAGPRFSPAGPDRDPEVAAAIWQHGKRNHSLRLAGLLRVVCPVSDASEVCGVGVFDAHAAEVDGIMAGDPAVIAGVLVYEIHPTRTFPESRLMD